MDQPVYTWKRIPSNKNTPSPRASFAWASYKKKIYLYGGKDENNERESFYVFNLEDLEWEQKLPVQEKEPETRTCVLSVLHDDSMFFYGGYKSQNSSVLSGLFEYNFQSNQWNSHGYFDDYAESYHYSTGLYRDNILYFGGSTGYYQTNKFVSYDLHQQKWILIQPSPKTPEQRYLHSGEVWNDSYFVFGGLSFIENNDFHRYDFGSGKWEEITQKNPETLWPKPRRSHRTFIHNNKMYLFGGYGHSIWHGDCIWIFDFRNYQWRKVDILGDIKPKKRRVFLFEKYHDSIILFGGFTEKHKFTKSGYVLKLKGDLEKDLSHFLKNQVLCDTTISCLRNQSIGAHKTILNARLKTNENIIKLNQKASTLERRQVFHLLKFIYTGIGESSYKSMFTPNLDSISNDYLSLLQNNNKNTNSNISHLKSPFDFKIQLDNQLIQVHKIMMAARSELYYGMLTIVDDPSGIAPDLSGLSHSAFILLLQFIYSDKINQNDIDLNDLIQLKDCWKYFGFRSNRLKRICNKITKIIK
ncbi:hypothetical protein M0811_05650 [Anaeramoeba ignava]|uniref:BTB domain-containing protein n=1 Tax=Anaeramoeba ignava TaxID=1746090 RepID=A0A9Q0LRU2_ANAIG|nr:hypothetical protein M0811_05650 [Anaeramoeba ignava]